MSDFNKQFLHEYINKGELSMNTYMKTKQK